MSHQLTQLGTAIVPTVPGSILHQAQQRNESFAVAWLAVQAVVLFDISASMDLDDAPGEERRTRYELAISELTKLQAQCPGRIALVQFNNSVQLCPGGVPNRPSSTTDLTAALEYVIEHRMDTPGMCIIVISDGEPDNPVSALRTAARFKNRIDVVYCGTDRRPDGREFLQRLSAASGGTLVTADRAAGLMAATVKLLEVAA